METLSERKTLEYTCLLSLAVLSITILFSIQLVNASLIGDSVSISMDGADNLSGQSNPQIQTVTQGQGPEFGWGAGSGCGIPDESISVDVEDSIINITLNDGSGLFVFCDDNGKDLGNPFSFNITSLDWVDEGGIVTGINFLNNSGTSFDTTFQVLGTHSVQINITAFGGSPLTTEFFDYELETLHGEAKVPTFGNPLQLSVNGETGTPHVVANSERVFAMWREIDDLFVAWSDDEGSTFQSPTSINSGLAAPLDPHIQLSGQEIRIAWKQGNSLLFSQSLDNGDSFSQPIDLSSGAVESKDPQIVTSGSKVYVVWDEQGQIDDGIHFAKSTNNGLNFDPSINLSGGEVDAIDPKAVANGDDIYIVWEELGSLQDVFFIKSDNAGVSFSSKVNLTNSTGGVAGPLVGLSGDNVYVAWADTSAFDIMFLKSSDKGNSFGTLKNLSDTDEISSFHSMEVFENNVYLTWRDRVGFGNDIYVLTSNDNGTTFLDSVNLSNSGGASVSETSVSSNIVDVSWMEGGSPGNIYFSRSDDSGKIFSIKQEILNSTIVPTGHELFTQGKNAYVFFQGDTGIFELEVFFIAGVIPVCDPPISGDWNITESCEIFANLESPASIMIQNNSVVTINSEGGLTIPAGENLIIVDGSGLKLIQGSTLIILS